MGLFIWNNQIRVFQIRVIIIRDDLIWVLLTRIGQIRGIPIRGKVTEGDVPIRRKVAENTTTDIGMVLTISLGS